MLFSEEEHRLAAETSIKYRGTACIELEALTFAYEADEKNVMRLKKFFKKNGCNRLDVRNHIPAVISQEQLDIAIRNSNTTAKALMNGCHTRDSFVELRFPVNFRLQCLHGSDRVRAATEVLSPADKHWIVDLYLEGRRSCLFCTVTGSDRPQPRPQPRIKDDSGGRVLL